MTFFRKLWHRLLGSLKPPTRDDPIHDALVGRRFDILVRTGAATVDPLLNVLNDRRKTEDLRVAAADALGQIGDIRAVAPLVELVDTHSNRLAKAAVDALVRIGSASVDPLLAALRSNSDRRRWAARATLGRIGDSRALEVLVETLHGTNEYERAHSARVLGQLRDERAIEPLVVALRDTSWSVVTAASCALASIKSARIIELVTPLLQDKEEAVRLRAVLCLWKLGDPSASVSLMPALRDIEWNVREMVAKALQGLGWQPSDPEQRAAFAVAIGRFEEAAAEGPAAIAPLLAEAARGGGRESNKAVDCLLSVQDRECLDPLQIGLKDCNWYVRKVACEALGCLGDPRATDALITMLGDGEEFVRATAAKALGKLGETRAVEPLVAAALRHHPQPEIANALQVLDAEGSITLLLPALTNPDRTIAKAAADTLDAVGWKPTNTAARLTLALGAGRFDDAVREGAASVDPILAVIRGGCAFGARAALKKISDPEAIGPLVQALTDHNADVRAAACFGLGSLGGIQAVKGLVSALNDSDASVSRTAADALAGIGLAIVDELFPLLNDAEDRLRTIALGILHKVGWRPADSSQQIVFAIAKGAFDLAACEGTMAIDPLLRVVENARELSWRRTKAAVALYKLDNLRAISSLVAMVQAATDNSRTKAVEALARIGDSRAVEPLMAAVKDPDRCVREKVAWALGQLRETRALEPLSDMLSDADSSVRLAAANALGILGDKRGFEPVLAILMSAGSSFLPGDAARVLGELGDGRAIQPLREALHENLPLPTQIRKKGNEHTVAATAVALGRLGDVQSLPQLLKLLEYPGFDYGNHGVRKAAAKALENILVGYPKLVSNDHLRILAQLKHEQRITYCRSDMDGVPDSDLYEGVDCSRLKELARQELDRRASRW